MPLVQTFVAKAAGMLDAEERLVVLGDLAEAGKIGWPALRDVLSLVVRRQVSLWKGWRPWAAVVSVIGFVGLPLNLFSLIISASLGRQLTTYWKYGIRYPGGLTAIEEITVSASFCLTLVVCCWTGGSVLAAISRQAIWSTGLVYLVLCSWPLSIAVALPLWTFSYQEEARRVEMPLVFVVLMLQIALQSLIVGLPTVLGIRHGKKGRILRVPQSRNVAAVTAVLAGAAIWMAGWQDAAVIRWSGGVWDPGNGWRGRLLPFMILCWPAGYMLVNATFHADRQRAHGNGI